MADVALRPTFSAQEVERLRKERQVSLLQTRDNAPALASAAFNRARIRTAPSLRHIVDGQRRVERRDVARRAEAVSLDVLSATERVPARRRRRASRHHAAEARKVFGAWKNSGSVPKPTLPAAEQPAARQIYLVDKPNAAQSEIRIGWIGVSRTTPDYFRSTS
jgi:predicted Zn-dependent peptidase